MSSDSIEWGVSHHGFVSQGTCYAWQPDILRLQAIADGLITLAYGSILVTLLYFLHKRADLRFNWMYLCLAIFMIACAAMHLTEIWTIWHPAYWLAGAIKAIAALALVTTSVFLIKLVHDGLRFPCPAALQIVNSSFEARDRSCIPMIGKDASRNRPTHSRARMLTIRSFASCIRMGPYGTFEGPRASRAMLMETPSGSSESTSMLST